MAGTRLTDENKALYTPNAQSDHRRTFRRYFGTLAVSVATAVSTLGGNFMAHARPPPVVVQDNAKQIAAAQTVLTKDTGAITRSFEAMRASDIGEVLYPANPLVQTLLRDLVAQNNALKPLNSGNNVFPISGTTSQEQFNSMNTWIGGSGPLTPERLTLLNNKISGAFGQVNAAIAAYKALPDAVPLVRSEAERQPLELTVPQQNLAFDDMDYLSLLHNLALIREHPKKPANEAQALSYIETLEKLYNKGKPEQANIKELNRLYGEARTFANSPAGVYARAEGQKTMEAAARQEKQEALLAIETRRAQLAKTFPDRDLTAAMVKLDEAKRLAEREMYPDARRVFTDAQILAQNAPKKPELRVAEPEARGGVRTAETTSAKQAYLHDIAQKTVELARFSYRSLVGSPIPDRKQKQATEARIRALTATEKFLAEAEALAANPTLTFDQVNSAYTTTLLRADTVQTMALLLRFAEANGMNKAPAKFFIAYADLAAVIQDPKIDYKMADDKLGGFYVEVSKFAPEIVSRVIDVLATSRASRDGFYAEYLQAIEDKPLTLEQTQKMLERAIAAYSPGRDPTADPLLIAANIWKTKCTDPMTLYAMAHNLVSIREAETWAYSVESADLDPFKVPSETRERLKQQINLAREAFLWNYKDDFTNPIRVDTTYYPNISTTLAEDVIYTLVPTLRFTGPYAGFYASLRAVQEGPVFREAVEIERDHVRMLLSMNYPFPSDPWSLTTPSGLNVPLAIHHAFEFGEGPYAVPELVSRSGRKRFDTGLPQITSGKERIYYLGPVTDLHPKHDAPGYAHNGLGAAVLRREAILVSDVNAPDLLKSPGFVSELGDVTAEFMTTGNGYTASLKIAEIRIAELVRRLNTVIEGDVDVPIQDLPSKADDPADPRIFYVQRALQALDVARSLKVLAETNKNTTTAKLALEVAELGLEGLSDEHLRDIYTPPDIPVETWNRPKIELEVRDFDGNDHICASTTANVRVETRTSGTKVYGTAEEYAAATNQVVHYNWQFYSFKNGDYYLLNPHYGESGQPMFLGKVVRGMDFGSGVTGDAVVAVTPNRSGWDVLGGENPFVLYRLEPSASPTSFSPVHGNKTGSIDQLLSTVSTISDKPECHMLYSHAHNFADVTITLEPKK